jgi:hypothetical protein
MRRSWTTDEKIALRRLARTQTGPQIARTLGRTTKAIYHMAQQLNIRLMKRGELRHNTKYPRSRVVEIRALFNTGKWTPRKLADKYDMKSSTVEAICYNHIRVGE